MYDNWAAKQQRRWVAEHPNETCNHPQLVREILGGMSSGDRVCTTCGETFSPSEQRELHKSQVDTSTYGYLRR